MIKKELRIEITGDMKAGPAFNSLGDSFERVNRRMREEAMTTKEKLNSMLSDLDQRFAAGGIDARTYKHQVGQARKKYGEGGGFFSSAKSAFGEESLLGNTLKMARGAGAVAAVGMGASMFANVAAEAKRLNDELLAGSMTADQVALELAKSVPIFGNLVKGAEDLASVLGLDGSSVLSSAKRINDELIKTLDLVRQNADEMDKWRKDNAASDATAAGDAAIAASPAGLRPIVEGAVGSSRDVSEIFAKGEKMKRDRLARDNKRRGEIVNSMVAADEAQITGWEGWYTFGFGKMADDYINEYRLLRKTGQNDLNILSGRAKSDIEEIDARMRKEIADVMTKRLQDTAKALSEQFIKWQGSIVTPEVIDRWKGIQANLNPLKIFGRQPSGASSPIPPFAFPGAEGAGGKDLLFPDSGTGQAGGPVDELRRKATELVLGTLRDRLSMLQSDSAAYAEAETSGGYALGRRIAGVQAKFGGAFEDPTLSERRVLIQEIQKLTKSLETKDDKLSQEVQKIVSTLDRTLGQLRVKGIFEP